MREGHVRRRGSGWEYIVSLNHQPRQACTACAFAQWGSALRSCPKCGAHVVLRDERRRRSVGGFRTRKQAEQALREHLGQIDRGRLHEPSKELVGQYLDRWLPRAKARLLRPGSYDAVELHVRVYIKPRIGHVTLMQLTPERVRDLYAELTLTGRVRGAAPLSAKTVHNIHRTLSRALKDAVADGVLLHNPAAGAHTQPESPEQATWTPVQLHEFFAFVAEDPLHALWRLAATGALRRGELAGLRWSDTDLKRRRLSVAQQRAKGGGTVQAGPTKTKKSKRLISLDKVTVAALQSHRARQLADQLRWGPGYEDHGLVFSLPNGQPLHPDRLTQRFRELCKDAGLPYIKLHGLRHSWATAALRGGVHPKVVQERLGHSSITITMDTYSHAIPSMQEDAAEHVANLFDTASDEVVAASGGGEDS